MLLKQKKQIASLFDALGHHRRITIIQELQKTNSGSMSHGALAKKTGMSETGLTHHIRMMKKGGIILAQTKGRNTILHLNLSQTMTTLQQLSSTSNTNNPII